MTMTVEHYESNSNRTHGDVPLWEATPSHDQTDGIPPAEAHGHAEHMRNITVPLRDVNAYTPQKKLRIVTIGAGYAGMTMAQKLQHKYRDEMDTILEHTIYEAKSKAGGTWIANTYPGV